MTDTPSIIQPTSDTEILFSLVDSSFFDGIKTDRPFHIELVASVNGSDIINRKIYPNQSASTLHEKLGLITLNDALLELYQTLTKYTIQQAVEIVIEIKVVRDDTEPSNPTHYAHYNGLEFWYTIFTRDIDPLMFCEQDIY